MTFKQAKYAAILLTLNKTKWNKRAAMRMLNLSEPCLYDYLKKMRAEGLIE